MIFSIEERRLVVHIAHQGEVEVFDCAADAACGNPVCRCRTTIVAVRSRPPGQPTRTVTFDLDARALDEAFRKRASADDLVFGERLLSVMDEDDFDLLSRLHYASKNRLSEKAHPSEIKVRFDFDEVEEASLLQAYNDILPFGDTFRITLDGTDYVVLDQYCVKPGCRCTDAHLNLIPAEDHGETVASSGALSVDYDAVSWEPVSGEPLPCDATRLRRSMETGNADLYKQFRARHKKLPAVYAHCRRRELEARQAVQDAGTIGRNDLCPCGSGKKYKKCCLGKPALSTPKAADKMRTSTIVSAIRTPRSP